MNRLRWSGAVLALLVSLLGGVASVAGQQQTPPGRRAQLEGRVLREFLDRTQAEMQLSADQRARIEQVMRATAQRNRERAHTAMELRRELRRAVEDTGTSDAEFGRLLERIEQLRAAEQEAWRADQREIAAVLTPRQRAIFSVRWMEFQERVRALIGQQRGMGPPRM